MAVKQWRVERAAAVARRLAPRVLTIEVKDVVDAEVLVEQLPDDIDYHLIVRLS